MALKLADFVNSVVSYGNGLVHSATRLSHVGDGVAYLLPSTQRLSRYALDLGGSALDAVAQDLANIRTSVSGTNAQLDAGIAALQANDLADVQLVKAAGAALLAATPQTLAPLLKAYFAAIQAAAPYDATNILLALSSALASASRQTSAGGWYMCTGQALTGMRAYLGYSDCSNWARTPNLALGYRAATSPDGHLTGFGLTAVSAGGGLSATAPAAAHAAPDGKLTVSMAVQAAGLTSVWLGAIGTSTYIDQITGQPVTLPPYGMVQQFDLAASAPVGPMGGYSPSSAPVDVSSATATTSPLGGGWWLLSITGVFPPYVTNENAPAATITPTLFLTAPSGYTASPYTGAAGAGVHVAGLTTIAGQWAPQCVLDPLDASITISPYVVLVWTLLLSAMSSAILQFSPPTSNEAVAVLTSYLASFDQTVAPASDLGWTGTVEALNSLRSAVSAYLQQSIDTLPRVLTQSFGDNLPDVVVAHALGDATLAPELVRINDPQDPSAMPASVTYRNG